MTRISVFEQMRGESVVDVGRWLGLNVCQSGSRPASIYGCPKCGAETRHSKSRDRRGAVGIRPDGRGWRCFQCDASGDGVDLVAHSLFESAYRDLRDDQRAAVRDKCCELVGGEPMAATSSGSTGRKSKPVKRATRSVATYAPSYPDADLDAFYGSLRPVVHAPYTAAYLKSRCIDPNAVADFDLARALWTGGPGSRPLPAWARLSRWCWGKLGYHLILPLYDACGRRRSVIARSVLAAEQRKHIAGRPIDKSTAPRGYDRAGLVMACPLAVQLLQTGAKPSWWSDEDSMRVVVAEGEADFLAWATSFSDADTSAPAVLGIVSGSWTTEIAARIPDGTTTVIAADDDEAGDKYAATVARHMVGRAVRVERWEAGAHHA